MSTEPDDNTLLLDCRDARERQDLLGELFMKHKDRLKRMVQIRMDARIQHRVDGSDVIQEVYIEASRRLDSFLANPEVPLFVWIRFLVGQNLQKLHRRHLGAQARDVRKEISLYHGAMPQATSEALAAQLLGQETSPSVAAIRAERKIYLQEALNSMNPVDREILALRHFEQLTSHEAAQVLGLKEPAARQRYFRALDRLKRILVGMPGWTEER